MQRGRHLRVAPKEALGDFLANREKPRAEYMPQRSRGISTPQHFAPCAAARADEGEGV
jgi:hypothetical protein